MNKILITGKRENWIKGLFNSLPYELNLSTRKIIGIPEENVGKIISCYENQLKDNPYLRLHVGTVVRYMVEEGHCTYEYDMRITSIEDECVDNCENYYCTAFGEGITEEDKELAAEFTSNTDYATSITILE